MMFDLAAFDAELDRRQKNETPGDDVLLAKSMRQNTNEAAITLFGPTSGAMLATLALFSYVAPFLIGDASAAASVSSMTYEGMNLEQFAMHMNMPLNEPYLIAMFEELCMT